MEIRKHDSLRHTYNFSERTICKTFIYSNYSSIGTTTQIVTVLRTDFYD